MSNVLEEDDGYDSIDEDAELELSCALHDLALRVKTFEENMKDRFHHADGDDDDGEISEEDIPEMDDVMSASGRRGAAASPKHSTRHRRKLSAKAAKQQSDDDDDDDELYDDDDEDHEHDGDYDDEEDGNEDHKGQLRERDDWDFQEQKEELSEMRQNIALLLQTIKAEAKALESREGDGDSPAAEDNNQ